MQITINDRTVQAESGDTIYVAAVRGGIHIPSLCASTHLSPYGSCRLCLGEIAGLAGLHATCSMPVSDGMVVPDGV
jgi:NADH dehydrogenase/NADH:ubiquinone oxidoreductase subunit G